MSIATAIFRSFFRQIVRSEYNIFSSDYNMTLNQYKKAYIELKRRQMGGNIPDDVYDLLSNYPFRESAMKEDKDARETFDVFLSYLNEFSDPDYLDLALISTEAIDLFGVRFSFPTRPPDDGVGGAAAPGRPCPALIVNGKVLEKCQRTADGERTLCSHHRQEARVVHTTYKNNLNACGEDSLSLLDRLMELENPTIKTIDLVFNAIVCFLGRCVSAFFFFDGLGDDLHKNIILNLREGIYDKMHMLQAYLESYRLSHAEEIGSSSVVVEAIHKHHRVRRKKKSRQTAWVAERDLDITEVDIDEAQSTIMNLLDTFPALKESFPKDYRRINNLTELQKDLESILNRTDEILRDHCRLRIILAMDRRLLFPEDVVSELMKRVRAARLPLTTTLNLDQIQSLSFLSHAVGAQGARDDAFLTYCTSIISNPTFTYSGLISALASHLDIFPGTVNFFIHGQKESNIHEDFAVLDLPNLLNALCNLSRELLPYQRTLRPGARIANPLNRVNQEFLDKLCEDIDVQITTFLYLRFSTEDLIRDTPSKCNLIKVLGFTQDERLKEDRANTHDKARRRSAKELDLIRKDGMIVVKWENNSIGRLIINTPLHEWLTNDTEEPYRTYRGALWSIHSSVGRHTLSLKHDLMRGCIVKKITRKEFGRGELRTVIEDTWPITEDMLYQTT